MGKHLTRIVPVTTLPDPAGYEEGYPLLMGGQLYTLQTGAWEATPGADREVVPVTAAHTVADVDHEVVVLADATSAAFDVTLPAVASGRTVTAKKVDSTANAVTVVVPGAETIDGAANHALATQHDTVTLVSDGADWYVV